MYKLIVNTRIVNMKTFETQPEETVTCEEYRYIAVGSQPFLECDLVTGGKRVIALTQASDITIEKVA